jgi:hypothetical protein
MAWLLVVIIIITIIRAAAAAATKTTTTHPVQERFRVTEEDQSGQLCGSVIEG